MAVFLYFGLPGCGKTTLMCHFALNFIRHKKYKNVYGNVDMAINGYTYIDNDCIGRYDLSECALLIDEGTLFADSRDYKNFSHNRLEYFLTHRHFLADIFIFLQQWDGIDRKIRSITDRVYYVYKGKIFGKWFTKYYRIPYDIIIPDPKKDKGSSQLGQIVQGYSKPDTLTRLLCPIIFRPMYYKYFDSFERSYMPELPPIYQEYNDNIGKVYFLKDYMDYLPLLSELELFERVEDLKEREIYMLHCLKKLYRKNLEECIC